MLFRSGPSMSREKQSPGPDPRPRRHEVAGAGGFEPPNARAKVSCLTAWPRPTNERGFRHGPPTDDMERGESCWPRVLHRGNCGGQDSGPRRQASTHGIIGRYARTTGAGSTRRTVPGSPGGRPGRGRPGGTPLSRSAAPRPRGCARRGSPAPVRTRPSLCPSSTYGRCR